MGCVQKESKQDKPVLTQLDSLNDVARTFLKVDLDSAKLLSEVGLKTKAQLDNDLKSQARAQLVLGRVHYERGTCDSSNLDVPERAKHWLRISRYNINWQGV